MAACLLLGTEAAGQERAPDAAVLRVGTRHAPPFAIKQPDGSWTGIAIELWRDVSADLGLRYELRERDLASLLDGLREGDLDAAVAALTMTTDREAAVDFTHPFHASGLGIAVLDEAGGNWLRALQRFPWIGLAQVLAGLFLVLLASGFLVWVFERDRNREQFGRGVRGLFSGLWWSAVTMTTVGYGDKAPRTVPGRIVALVWMFVSIFMIATFTATMASTLTTAQLEFAVRGPQDLPSVRVGTVAASTSVDYLLGRRIAHRTEDSLDDALAALVARDLDAVVYDAPILRYVAARELPGRVAVLPQTFAPQQYAIGLPAGSPLREPINRSLLRIVGLSAWQELLARYLGS